MFEFKGYKEFRDDILDWTKTRLLNTVKIIYNPDDDVFMKAFEIEWNKDPKCKDISLEIFTQPSFKEKDLVPAGEPILTGGLNSKSSLVYGELIPFIENKDMGQSWKDVAAMIKGDAYLSPLNNKKA